jgi:cytochrome c-type biogenesis protein CcmE
VTGSGRKRLFALAGMILVLALGISAYIGLGHGAEAEILSLRQLRAWGEAAYGQQLQVKGTVKPGSVDWQPQEDLLRFRLVDQQEELEVVYRGEIPPEFRVGAQLVVRGRYSPPGILEASSLGKPSSLCTTCHD